MVKERIAFSIVAPNYLGLAQLLGASILKYDTDVKFYIFVADEPIDSFVFPEDLFYYRWVKTITRFDDQTWYKMAFQYNVTEFCTSVKPSCFIFLMDKYEFADIIYLDPDIIFYSSLKTVWYHLGSSEILLTPHFVTIEEEFSGDILENQVLGSGIYNLGFLAINSSKKTLLFMKWWQKRLVDQCFVEKAEHLYTDQRWIDFLPSFFSSDDLLIIRELGWNVAPWNFYERKLSSVDGQWMVNNRLMHGSDSSCLLFVHFSGFNYLELLKTNKNIPYLKNYEDIYPLLESYSEEIRCSSFFEHLKAKYFYGFFDNGQLISGFHRRLWRRYSNDLKFENPFNCSNSFYLLLRREKLIINPGDNPDKMNERSLPNFEGKIRIINWFHRLLFKILGFNRYILYSKFMLRYYRPENQTFLLRSKTKFVFWNENFKMK